MAQGFQRSDGRGDFAMIQKMAAAVSALALVAGALVGAQPLAPNRLCTDWAAGHVTMEVLGDSVAAGYGVAAGERWFERVAAQLPGPSSAVWNGAVSGSKAADYVPGAAYNFHVQFAGSVAPTLVVLNWRINDQWWSKQASATFNPTTFKAQYRLIMDQIHAASPTTQFVIAVSPWVMDTRLDAGTFSQWDYIVALWDLKEEYGAVWMDWMRFTSGLLQADQGHPTSAGNAVMAAQVFEYIRSSCGHWGE